MKKLFGSAALFALFALAGAAAQSKGSVEISFSYARQNGPGSNQFAVWVEDAQGRYIKTLYATRFTARGGWERKPASLRRWVTRSNLPSIKAVEIDAFSSATPREGAQTYRWDGSDSKGAALPAGSYMVYIEGSLRDESRVVYSAAVRLGQDSGEVPVKSEYAGSAASERAMIGNVKVRVNK